MYLLFGFERLAGLRFEGWNDLLKAVENGPIAQFWLERTPDKREVTGSSPVRPTSIRLKVRGRGKRNKEVERKPKAFCQ